MRRTDVIKEYLVSLGFDVDNASLSGMDNAMGRAEKSVSGFASSAVSSFIAAGVAVTSFVAVVDAGIAKFLGDLAQADLANEKFARQMWTSKDAAMSYNNTLKAMGVTLQDLYLSPEILQRFNALRAEINNMKPPADYENMMKGIRDIQFEFARLKLEATYAMQWIGYYLIKYIQAPLNDLKINLGDLNDNIQDTMPQWTKYVAEFASWFVRLGVAIAHLAIDIKDLFDKIPKGAKIAGTGILAFFTILGMGPIGIFIITLTALLLLLDDFYTYRSGGDSALAGFWEQLDDSGVLDDVSEGFQEVMKWLDKLYTDFSDSGVLKDFGELLKNIAINLLDIIKILDDLGYYDFVLAGWKLGFQTLDDIIKALNATLRITHDLLNFDLPSAGKDVQNYLTDQATRQEKWQSDLEKNHSTTAGFLDSLTDIYNGILGPSGWLGGLADSLGGKMDNFMGVGGGSSPTSTINTYIYPQPGKTSAPSVTLNPTYNIYGSSSPDATANAVQRNDNALLTRAMQGVTR